MNNKNIEVIKDILHKGFEEPDTYNQITACKRAITAIYELEDTNQSELAIYLRDFLLDYIK